MSRFILASFLFLCFLTPQAHAGSTAAEAPVLPVDQIKTFANRVQTDLAAQNAHVAIVARVGRHPDQLPDGIDYTHVGFWVYSTLNLANGETAKGYRVYNLYQLADDPGRSTLIQDSPAEFFTSVYSLDAGIIIPDRALQEKLLEVLASPTYADLHNPDYTVFANPASTTFQNCTEHTLDVLMASLYDTDDQTRIKANIDAYFTPQPITVAGPKRALAPVVSSAYRSSDHDGEIETATFNAIKRFMQQYNLTQATYRLTQEDRAPL